MPLHRARSPHELLGLRQTPCAPTADERTTGVDERKDAEASELRQQLREQAERLTLALQAANLGTWEHVPGSHATLWDVRSKSIFGLGEHEELDFESYVASIHPGDVERVFAGITKSMDPASGGECSLQY